MQCENWYLIHFANILRHGIALHWRKIPLCLRIGRHIFRISESLWLGIRHYRLWFLDMWQGWIVTWRSLEHLKCQSEGCPKVGGVHLGIRVIAGYTPWKHISSIKTLASTQHGNTHRIHWKHLVESAILQLRTYACDDDDDETPPIQANKLLPILS